MKDNNVKKLGQEYVDFLAYSFKNKLPLELKWCFNVFAYIAEPEYEDEFFVVKDNTFFYKIKDDKNQQTLEALVKPYKEAVFRFNDEIQVPKGFLPNIKKDLITTPGRLIANYILLVIPFGDKIEYINKQFDIGDIENNYIIKLLSDEPKDGEISVDEYLKFLDSVEYIQGLATVLNRTATPKAVLPPPNIDEYRKKVIKEFINKYGEKGLQDPTIVKEIESKLEEYDNEYLKGDPTLGKLLKGKTKNIARKKMYLDFGIGNAVTGTAKPILYSLSDGWKKDPEDLATFYNDARGGSYGRGAETQQGGVVAKDTLRATSDIKIINTDCGTKVYRKQLITDKNYKLYFDRFINDNGKTVKLTLDNINKYIGKEVKLYTPMGCKLAPHFCTKCMGESIKDYENGMALMASGVGGTILNQSLKKFHGTALEVVDLELSEFH